MKRRKATVRRVLAAVATLFVVTAGLVSVAPAASADTCDGWTIAKPSHVGTYGAIHLLRNYCHSSGPDYTLWMARGFLYDKQSQYVKLRAELWVGHSVVDSCGIAGDDGGPNVFCTTSPPVKILISNPTPRFARGIVTRCVTGSPCVTLALNDTATVTS